MSEPVQERDEMNWIEVQLQTRLSEMVCLGLFEPCNEECVRKMIDVTGGLEHPWMLLEWGTYPIMAEMLINNMKRSHQKQPLSGHLEPNTTTLPGIQLRNINNIS